MDRMKTNKPIKLVTFVGMCGSGKSTCSDFLKERGIPDVYLGGIIYKAMAEAGIEVTPKSQEIFREQIREKEGKDFVINRAIKEVDDLIGAGQKRIIIDGIYSWTEWKIAKHTYPGELTTIAIVAPKKLRHSRLAHRPGRPFDAEQSRERDWTEIEHLEKGGPIAIADYYLNNTGSIEQLEANLEKILREIDFLD
jgi:dephospho-CoA kinase